jgi:hypothetical protein
MFTPLEEICAAPKSYVGRRISIDSLGSLDACGVDLIRTNRDYIIECLIPLNIDESIWRGSQDSQRNIGEVRETLEELRKSISPSTPCGLSGYWVSIRLTGRVEPFDCDVDGSSRPVCDLPPIPTVQIRVDSIQECHMTVPLSSNR